MNANMQTTVEVRQDTEFETEVYVKGIEISLSAVSNDIIG